MHCAAAPPVDTAQKVDEENTRAQRQHEIDATGQKKANPNDPNDLVSKIEKVVRIRLNSVDGLTLGD